MFQLRLLDNSLLNVAWFAGIILLAFLFRRYLSHLMGLLIYKAFKKLTKQTYYHQFQALVLPPLQYAIYFLIVRAALEMLHYPAAWKVKIWSYPLQNILNHILETVIWFFITWLLLRLVEFIAYMLKVRAQATPSPTDHQWIPYFRDSLKLVVLVLSLLFLLGALYGLNITSLLAGVGIGGLAVALAAQESLKNLFGSLTIFTDKPFTIGDVVRIDDVTGTVEQIGFRNTRIRTVEKTYVTLPNKMMVDSYVENLTMRTYRRVKMQIGVKYETPPEALRKILSELDTMVKQYGDADTDNYAVFDTFGDSALIITLEYLIPHSTFLEFLKEKQEINFRIMEIVLRNGSDFPYPIREVHMVPPQ